MKRFIAVLSTILVLLVIISGCSITVQEQGSNASGNSSAAQEAKEINPEFDFMTYKDLDDIINIEKIELDDELSGYCSSYKFKYKSDDCKVAGYLSVPNECVESAVPYECIIYNRGGNISLGLLQDSDTAKMCKQLNKVIIASQYRGADGGTGTDEFGGDDINDVIKLIDICEQLKFVDMNNLCSIGVSRGGMMTYMAAKSDDRIKRIAVVSGVANLVASYDERKDMALLLINSIGGSPGELSEEYTKRSAVSWADKINVPVLIIHSKNDKSVSCAQAQAMIDKLKKYNKDVSFVLYDDSVHGIHSKDSMYIKNWMNGKKIEEKDY